MGEASLWPKALGLCTYGLPFLVCPAKLLGGHPGQLEAQRKSEQG